MLDLALPLLAESGNLIDDKGVILAAGCFAVGIIVIGVGLGIGKLAGNAVESISRQPEAGGRIVSAMLIAASLIEGVAFFAIVVCIIAFFI